MPQNQRPHGSHKTANGLPAPTPPPSGAANNTRRYLNKQQLIAATGLSAATIERYKAAGTLPYAQPGGKGSRVLYPLDAIEGLGGARRDPNPSVSPGDAARDPDLLTRRVHQASTTTPVTVASTAPKPPRRRPGRQPRWQSIATEQPVAPEQTTR